MVKGHKHQKRTILDPYKPQWEQKRSHGQDLCRENRTRGNAVASDLPGIYGFAKGLQHDFDAVTAGLALPHSSGAVEGNMNRLKTLEADVRTRQPRLAQETNLARPLTGTTPPSNLGQIPNLIVGITMACGTPDRGTQVCFRD
ncbi:hypothetical protein LO763_14080 [Glycomyces sp. A-F 0318]|uniref:hypothetical protein n=1 Tax=Glycomyces amatae TaxID=2881355 RepID=UPI001E5FD626|nr:hypothetical protein [Glycomyces amatae]MCD0444746.1 hypothetical protein [Glycomyces amatae]